LPGEVSSVESLSEVGIILLLFSVGIELSLSKLSRVGNVAVVGSIIQMLVVGVVVFNFLMLFNFPSAVAIVLATGFSLSSTAVVVKMLEDRAETESIHGEISIGWLLTQDLAVIPIIALLPALAGSAGGGWISEAASSLFVSGLIVAIVFFIGRMVAPYLTHLIASTESRELLVLGGVALALGTAYFTSLFGVSAALGAFLAGVVISETQENHAIFSETRPLRDIFVILFFATLGFFIDPVNILNSLPFILALAVFVLVIKTLVVYILMYLLGYKGKTAVNVSLSLNQVGEFSFVIFLSSQAMGILSHEQASVGVATTLITLLLTPLMFRLMAPSWRFMKSFKMFQGKYHKGHKADVKFKNHIIVCGFGRMGSWVGNALAHAKIPFVVIDYNQRVVRDVQASGIPVFYGDPAESDVMERAGVREARAVVIAIPDRVTQEEVISYAKKANPDIHIFGRGHLDVDVKTLTDLKVDRIIQPEFEASTIVLKDILRLQGKKKDYVDEQINSLRRAHTVSLE